MNLFSGSFKLAVLSSYLHFQKTSSLGEYVFMFLEQVAEIIRSRRQLA